jgi:PilZ domain
LAWSSCLPHRICRDNGIVAELRKSPDFQATVWIFKDLCTVGSNGQNALTFGPCETYRGRQMSAPCGGFLARRRKSVTVHALSTEMNTDHVYGSPDGRERRRAARRPVADQPASMPIVASAQVIDISRTGVLLAADCLFTPGDRGTVCVDINRSSLKAAIQVQRVAPNRTGGSHRHELGASFVTPSGEHNLLFRHL